MKNLILAFAVLITGFVSAQEVNKPTIEKKGDLIQATYYHDNGAIAQQGFFNKQNKLVGTWLKFDNEGNKLAVGKYEDGKKVGKWLFWIEDTLQEVDYNNNVIVNVTEWKSKKDIAIRD